MQALLTFPSFLAYNLNRMEQRYSRIFFLVFFSSFATLAFEITLTRIFSISLWYHFAFMVVSIAMLGFGAGGTLVSVYPALKKLSNMPVYGVLLGLNITLGYLLSNLIPFDPVRMSWDTAQLWYILCYYAVLSLPFFFSGIMLSAAFSSISEKSGALYAADLLGASAGSAGILLILSLAAPEKAVFLLSSTVLIATMVIGGRLTRGISMSLILINLFLLLAWPSFARPVMSQYKGLEASLRFPGAEHLGTYFSPFSRVDTFKSPAVRFAPGLSLRFLDRLPDQIGIAVDGGDLNAVTSYQDLESRAFLDYLPSALPYKIMPKYDVAVLEPGGGLQVLVAEHNGSKNIVRIESNPFLMEVLRDNYSDMAGIIYRENSWSGLGRTRLRLLQQKFDIIDMPMTGTATAAHFGLSEDYRYTVEAFKEYLGSLKQGGVLSISLYLLPPPRTELRLLNTIIAALDEKDAAEAAGHIAAIRSWDSICLLVKKTPFDQGELEALKAFAEDLRFDLVYYPGIKEAEGNRFIRTALNDYSVFFKSLLEPSGRERFVRDYVFDIKEVDDDSPFFNYFLKLKNAPEIFRTMGGKWQYFIEEGYLIPVMFAQALVISLVLILLPAFRRGGQDAPGRLPSARRGKALLPYFAFLGLGYMFVEIALIQKTILPIENPSYAFALVLASMLASSGLGSLAGRTLGSRSRFVPACIAVVLVIYSLLLPPVMSALAPLSMPARTASVFLVIMPPGILMGMPFPAGMKLLGEVDSPLVPWAWSINGCFSVLAPVLAIMIALGSGFRTVFWLGAASYGMAFLSISLFSASPRSSAQRPRV